MLRLKMMRPAVARTTWVTFSPPSSLVTRTRGPQIQDVWLDFAGGFTGLLVMLALWALLRRAFRSRRRADV